MGESHRGNNVHWLPGGPGRGLGSGLTPLSRLSVSPLHGPLSMKGKSTRLRNATGLELWQRVQRPLQDLQLWKALAQRLLDVTASLPDLPSIHTFLPQIEVTSAGGRREATSQARCRGRISRERRVPGCSRNLGRVHRTLPGKSYVGTGNVISDKGHPQFLGRKQSLVPGVTAGLYTDPLTPLPFRGLLQTVVWGKHEQF